MSNWCETFGVWIRGLAVIAALAAGWTAGVATAQDAVDLEAGRPVLSLRECVLIAVRESPTLQTAAAQRDIFDQDVKTAWGAFLPDLTVGHNYSKADRTDYDVPQFGLGSVPLTDSAGDVLLFPTTVATGEIADEKISSTYRDVNFAARMNIFEGLAKYSRLGSSHSEVDAAEANRLYTTELVIQNVAMAYFRLLLAEELYEVATDTRSLAAKELERTETYFRLGSAAKSDVLQQRVRLQQTKFDAVVVENGVEQAFANLAYAMNQPLAERFAVDRSVLTTEFAIEDLATLYHEALSNRLDLKSDQYRLEARREDVTTATGNLWPRIDLYADWTRYDNQSPFRFGSQESQNWRSGYSVSWNVFDRMQTLARRSTAKASARIAEYNLEQARLDAQLEVRQLYNTMIEAREKTYVSNETVAQAQEEVRLAAERFRVGAGTTLDQINAQNNLASARAEEVRAIVEFLAAEVQMERAVGRFSLYTGQIDALQDE